MGLFNSKGHTDYRLGISDKTLVTMCASGLKHPRCKLLIKPKGKKTKKK
jgi:hypothetical protein